MSVTAVDLFAFIAGLIMNAFNIFGAVYFFEYSLLNIFISFLLLWIIISIIGRLIELKIDDTDDLPYKQGGGERWD